jgi:hypothetical protein
VALGHTPSEWIVDQEPAPGVEGGQHVECTSCHVVLEKAGIEALPIETEPETEFETELGTETEPKSELTTVSETETVAEPDTDMWTEQETLPESDSKEEEPVTSDGCSGIVGADIFCFILMMSVASLFFAKRKKEKI